MSNHQEQVESLLFSIGTSDLAKQINHNRLSRIEEFGHPIEPQILSEILYSEYGLNVFSLKSLRMDLLLQYYPKFIEEIKTSPDQEIIKALEEFNNFNWGNNIKSREFLKLFDLDEFSIKKNNNYSLESREEVIIPKCLYSYQNWTRKRINQFLFSSKKSKLIVQMPTGSGKTRTMLESVSDYLRLNEDSNLVVVWLAHSEELCEQAVESFEKMWTKSGSENAQIIRLWGGMTPENLEITKPTFVVTSFATAYLMTVSDDNERFSLSQDIKINCGLMVIDEAHQSIAPTYKTAIELLSNRLTKIVGLTATPGRHHIEGDPSETIKLANFYENNHINIVDDEGNDLDDPIKYLTEMGVLSKVTNYALSHDPKIALTESELRQLKLSLDIPESVLKKLGEDGARNTKIVDAALKQSEERNFQTIIFAPSKESAINIALFIRLRNGDARAVVGDTPSADRLKYINEFKKNTLKVLVNYGVLTTGFDAPNIQSVIIARPTTSIVLYSQMLGRGIRGERMGGTKDCDVIDVHDNILNMPSNSHAYMYFNKFYQK
jgi:DNA repair protein RadD